MYVQGGILSLLQARLSDAMADKRAQIDQLVGVGGAAAGLAATSFPSFVRFLALSQVRLRCFQYVVSFCFQCTVSSNSQDKSLETSICIYV